MRIENTPAVILHRRPWRETSAMVEAFSRDHGRVGLIARGARRNRARWRGVLEPLAAVNLSWTGRGELFTLTGAEAERAVQLSGNRLLSGFYASELVLRLTAREDPHAAIFHSLSALLQALADGAPPVVALRFFERDVLQAIGYGLSLSHDANTGEPVDANVPYAWHPQRGLYRGEAGGEAVAVPGSALLGLAAGRFRSRADVHAVRGLLRAVIASHLGGRPLKSLQTLHAMRQFKAGPTHGT